MRLQSKYPSEHILRELLPFINHWSCTMCILWCQQRFLSELLACIHMTTTLHTIAYKTQIAKSKGKAGNYSKECKVLILRNTLLREVSSWIFFSIVWWHENYWKKLLRPKKKAYPIDISDQFLFWKNIYSASSQSNVLSEGRMKITLDFISWVK